MTDTVRNGIDTNYTAKIANLAEGSGDKAIATFSLAFSGDRTLSAVAPMTVVERARSRGVDLTGSVDVGGSIKMIGVVSGMKRLTGPRGPFVVMELKDGDKRVAKVTMDGKVADQISQNLGHEMVDGDRVTLKGSTYKKTYQHEGKERTDYIFGARVGFAASESETNGRLFTVLSMQTPKTREELKALKTAKAARTAATPAAAPAETADASDELVF